MRLALLLALALAPNRFLLLDKTIEVPAAGWSAIDFTLEDTPARIDCSYRLTNNGAGVRLALLPHEAVQRLRAGRSHNVLAATEFAEAGALRYHAAAGAYALVVDNSLDGRGPALVRVRASLVIADRQEQAPTVLGPQRRAVIVACSVAFFLAVVLVAGRKLWRAFAERAKGPPPTYWG